jgi:CTP synthase
MSKSSFADAGCTKYIALMGGVCGSLDKGAIAASIGAVLKAYGYRVTAIKLDPYFNIDKSQISPFQHGEVRWTGDSAVWTHRV